MSTAELPPVPTMEELERADLANAQMLRDAKGDDALFVEFYRNAADGQDHVRIIIPGDERTQPDYLANDYYKRRFHRQWAAYQGDGEQFSGQTRIEEVAWIDPGTASDMRRNRIYTLEILANMSDGQISSTNMMGLMALRQKAKDHLRSQEKVAEFDKVRMENAALQQQLQELTAKVDAMSNQRRGRQPKVNA